MRSAVSAREAIEAAAEMVVELVADLECCGGAVARPHLDGAVVALRHAAAAFAAGGRTKHVADLSPPLSLDGFPTPVRLARIEGEVWLRGVLSEADGGRTFVQDAFAATGVAEWPAADLACDLLLSGAADGLARDPAGAALLRDALCRRDWLHSASGARWSIGSSGARSVVAALRGGLAVHSLAAEVKGRYVDAEALAAIETLGWRRCPNGRRDPHLPVE